MLGAFGTILDVGSNAYEHLWQDGEMNITAVGFVAGAAIGAAMEFDLCEM